MDVNKDFQRRIHDLFNTNEGNKILAWMVKSYILDEKASNDLSHSEMAYINGRNDFIKLLVTISDFDFVKFMGDTK